MFILALDVSSTSTGWAVVAEKNGAAPWVQSFGVISPRFHVSVSRIDATVDKVVQLVAGMDRVVMEWHQGRFHGARRPVPGLSILGQAQGAVRQALRAIGRDPVLVSEREWTGRKPKEARAAQLRMICPAYRDHGEGDTGFDAADAIQIGFWYLDRQREREILEHAKAKA